MGMGCFTGGSGREQVLNELMQRVASPPDAVGHAQGRGGGTGSSDEDDDLDDEAGAYSEEDVVLVMEFAGLSLCVHQLCKVALSEQVYVEVAHCMLTGACALPGAWHIQWAVTSSLPGHKVFQVFLYWSSRPSLYCLPSCHRMHPDRAAFLIPWLQRCSLPCV